ncbi:MAG: alpha/beta hydrolase [Myxococcota bacterium]|nr:alpha/beta hydrolase [Myxococcota bacterium]
MKNLLVASAVLGLGCGGGKASPQGPSTSGPKVSTVQVEGAELQVTDSGSGTAVLFIHPVVVRDAATPLMADPALNGKYRFITYHRRGFGQPTGAVSLDMQAADAAAVLKHVGVDRAHVVGISYGAAIALQLAVDSAGQVQSLTLMEPPMFHLVPSGGKFIEAVGPVVKAYQDKNNAGALEMFLGAIGGPEIRASMDKNLPAGAWDNSLTNLDTFFQVEFPALGEWKFGADAAKTIKSPTLFLKASESHPAFREGADVLAPWIPQMKVVDVAGANHLMSVTHAPQSAAALATFWAAN